MIATGTDIKPLEIVMFMRSVKSRSFFEQMKGRGVRVISDTDFQAVTPDANERRTSSSSMPSASANAIRPTHARSNKSQPSRSRS